MDFEKRELVNSYVKRDIKYETNIKQVHYAG